MKTLINLYLNRKMKVYLKTDTIVILCKYMNYNQ